MGCSWGKIERGSLESYDDDESADTVVGWFLQLSQLLRDSHRINTLLESAAVGSFVSHFIHYPYTEKQRKKNAYPVVYSGVSAHFSLQVLWILCERVKSERGKEKPTHTRSY